MDDIEMGKAEAKEANEEQSGGRTFRFMRRLIPRKRWEDLSPAQKVGNLLMAIVELTLVSLALWDLWHRPAEAINGKKRTWALASLIQPIGPIIYFIFGRKRDAVITNGSTLPA